MSTIEFRGRIKHVQSPRRKAQQSSCQTPRWGQLISPVVGDLFQYQTAACACLVWRHTAIVIPLMFCYNRPSEEADREISHVCPCHVRSSHPMMLGCDELPSFTPKSHWQNFPPGKGNVLIWSLHYNIIIESKFSCISLGVLAADGHHSFVFMGPEKAEVITLVPGLQTPEEK